MVQIIVGTMGTSPFAVSKTMSNASQMRSFLDMCGKYNVKQLDTARLYGGGRNEELLGEVEASSRFNIGTKIARSEQGGTLRRDNIMKSVEASFKALNVKSVDILYIHAPDRESPLEETLSAFNELYKQGKYKRFGICNYPESEVREICMLCKEKKYVLPSVYQGNYNPIARLPQKQLFPTLREFNMAFYGFGTLAGGFMLKPADQLKNASEDSRFGALPMLKDAYLQDQIIEQIEKFQIMCKEQGISPLNATLRWAQHHSGLQEQDGIILGASNVEQIESNLEALEGGPLDQSLVSAFDEMWEKVESVAFPYHR